MDRPERDEPTKRAASEEEADGRESSGGLTRRGFLGVVAGAGAASQIGCEGGASSMSKIHGATQSTTVCPFCGVGCGQVAYTRGDMLHVEGDPEHPISEGPLCSKGAAIGQLSNNPHRLSEVLYRAPGATSFEKKSWDWAYERIAQRVKETRDASFTREVDGAPVNRTEAIACLGGAALDNEECYLLVKAMRSFGVTYLEHQARI